MHGDSRLKLKGLLESLKAEESNAPAMENQVCDLAVKRVQIYTNPTERRNRQFVVIMSDKSVLRFTEGSMLEEKEKYSDILTPVIIQDIRDKVYPRVMGIDDGTPGWLHGNSMYFEFLNVFGLLE